MNREQIQALYEQAQDEAPLGELIEYFAELVAAAEREACAKVCEEISDDYMRSESRLYPEMKTDAQAGASDCEAAIRARNTNKETK